MIEKERKSVGALVAELAQRNADIKTIVGVVSKLLTSLGIETDAMKDGDLNANLPGLLGKVTTQLMTGTFDPAALAGIASLQPIFDRYKHLSEDRDIQPLRISGGEKHLIGEQHLIGENGAE